MKYKFDYLNSGLEIIDPVITIIPDNITIYPSSMEIEVDIRLETSNAKFGIRLTNVKVQNLNYDGNTLHQRVMERLNDFIV